MLGNTYNMQIVTISIKVCPLIVNGNISYRAQSCTYFIFDNLFLLLFSSDNDFEYLSPKIKNLVNLRILAIRDNEMIEVPEEIAALTNLRELHLQGNRLTVLPPQLGQLDFLSSRRILKLENNPWVPPIEDQLIMGVSHVIEYIRTETYKYLYSRHIQANVPPPDKSEKISKRTLSRKNSRASLNG